MTPAEWIALAGFLVWFGERIASWTHKKEVVKRLKKLNGDDMSPPPDLKDLP